MQYWGKHSASYSRTELLPSWQQTSSGSFAYFLPFAISFQSTTGNIILRRLNLLFDQCRDDDSLPTTPHHLSGRQLFKSKSRQMQRTNLSKEPQRREGSEDCQDRLFKPVVWAVVPEVKVGNSCRAICILSVFLPTAASPMTPRKVA